MHSLSARHGSHIPALPRGVSVHVLVAWAGSRAPDEPRRRDGSVRVRDLRRVHCRGRERPGSASVAQAARARGHPACAPSPFWYFSGVARSAVATDTAVARTIRFPPALREKIAADAERCGRSFEAQVVALLRRHYGEDVDIAPSPADIVALATASLSGIEGPDLRSLVRKLRNPER